MDVIGSTIPVNMPRFPAYTAIYVPIGPKTSRSEWHNYTVWTIIYPNFHTNQSLVLQI